MQGVGSGAIGEVHGQIALNDLSKCQRFGGEAAALAGAGAGWWASFTSRALAVLSLSFSLLMR